MGKQFFRDRRTFTGLFITVSLLTFLVVSTSHAASVTLAWDPSPSAVDGYKLNYSPNSLSLPYQNEMDAGTSLSLTVSNLLPGNSYAFAVSAYKGTLESAYSNQVGVSVSAQDIPFLDNDLDKMPDSWEMSNFSNLQQDPSGDFDGDGITNLNEYYNGSDPCGCRWAVSGNGATTCVSSSSGLQKCLSEAGADGRDNTVLVQTGDYSGNFSYVSGPAESYDLNIIGGYNSGCSASQYLPEATTLDGGRNGTVLTIDTLQTGSSGNILVERLQLANGVNPVADGAGGCLGIFTRNGRVDVVGNLLNNCDAFEGGGLFVENTSGVVVLANNVIHDNTADIGGGAGVASTSGAITLIHNTMAQNTASVQGGGFDVWLAGSSATLDVTNNIVWGNVANVASAGDDIHIYSAASLSGTLELSHNLADFGGGVSLSDPAFIPDSTNITGDPLFLSPVSDVFLLSGGSPAIDHGITGHPEATSVDINGDNRVINGIPDLGAYEYGFPVQLLSPNGGEALTSATAFTIRWSAASGATRYMLHYSQNGGATYYLIGTVNSGTATSYSWAVPILLADTNRALVKVEAYNGNSLLNSDTSDSVFSIKTIDPGTAPPPSSGGGGGGGGGGAGTGAAIAGGGIAGAALLLLLFF